VIACDPNNASILRNYRSDIEMIFPMIDPQMFNTNVKKIDLSENKFVFLSPQRIEKDKGQLVMWDALNYTKSDFVVLQTDWGTGKYYEQAILNKPKKVKIIPKIPRENIPSYYVSSDALLGQISPTTCGGVEREAILCGVPVFCYPQCGFTDDDPFYKKSSNSRDIAEYIDKIVEDRNFREELKNRQRLWITKEFDNGSLSLKLGKILLDASKIDHQKPKLFYHVIMKLDSILRDIESR
jgi:glycosyltransferase involved in cell wall biosynthesis